MLKLKNRIIAATVIVVALAAAWFASGNSPSREQTASLPTEIVEITSEPEQELSTEKTTESEQELSTEKTAEPDQELLTEESTELVELSEASETPKQEIDPSTGKDKYLTDPVPEGKPIPIEPQDAIISDVEYTCILSVRCDTILNNMDRIDKEKIELVPGDGVIFEATEVIFYEGESVFNVLQREMRRAKIHMSFRNTPIYNSAYIEAINNLYEFDVGELSGWMYKVNGWFPNYGCSRYQVKPGDVIEWVYTCDLGRDVGDTYYSTGGGGG